MRKKTDSTRQTSIDRKKLLPSQSSSTQQVVKSTKNAKPLTNDMAKRFADKNVSLTGNDINSYLLYYLDKNDPSRQKIIDGYDVGDISGKIFISPELQENCSTENMSIYLCDNDNRMQLQDKQYRSLPERVARLINAIHMHGEIPKWIVIPISINSHAVLVAVKPDKHDKKKATIIMYNSFGNSSGYATEEQKIIARLKKVYPSKNTEVIDDFQRVQKDGTSCQVFVIEAVKTLIRYSDNLAQFKTEIKKLDQNKLYQKRQELAVEIEKDKLVDDYEDSYRVEKVKEYGKEILTDDYWENVLNKLEFNEVKLSESIEGFLSNLKNSSNNTNILPLNFFKLFIDFKNILISTDIHSHEHAMRRYASFLSYLIEKIKKEFSKEEINKSALAIFVEFLSEEYKRFGLRYDEEEVVDAAKEKDSKYFELLPKDSGSYSSKANTSSHNLEERSEESNLKYVPLSSNNAKQNLEQDSENEADEPATNNNERLTENEIEKFKEELTANDNKVIKKYIKDYRLAKVSAELIQDMTNGASMKQVRAKKSLIRRTLLPFAQNNPKGKYYAEILANCVFDYIHKEVSKATQQQKENSKIKGSAYKEGSKDENSEQEKVKLTKVSRHNNRKLNQRQVEEFKKSLNEDLIRYYIRVFEVTDLSIKFNESLTNGASQQEIEAQEGEIRSVVLVNYLQRNQDKEEYGELLGECILDYIREIQAKEAKQNSEKSSGKEEPHNPAEENIKEEEKLIQVESDNDKVIVIEEEEEASERSRGSLWCCLFPCLSRQKINETSDEELEEFDTKNSF